MLREEASAETVALRQALASAREEVAALKARLAIAEADAAELCELRDLFDEAPIAYIHEGVDSRFIRANRAAGDLLGISPEAIDGTVGMSFISMAPETQRR
ncbi:PAS domain-containing protein, partial [Sphingomonas sp. UYP23]